MISCHGWGRSWPHRSLERTTASRPAAVQLSYGIQRLADAESPQQARRAQGRRPVWGTNERLHTDAHWRDHLLFYEYFHGETGAGLGANHQTGWTALVAKLLEQIARAPEGAHERALVQAGH